MRNGLRTKLYGTTALQASRYPFVRGKIRREPVTNDAPKTTIIRGLKTDKSGPVLLIRCKLDCPALKQNVFLDTTRGPTRYLTRYIERKYLNSAVLGTIRFGTTQGYRAAEAKTVGRLGDHTEGRLIEAFSSRSQFYNSFRVGQTSIEGIEIKTPVGTDGIGIELQVNDYCFCASSGEFSAKQASDLLKRGNGKLGAYVTYDLVLLLAGLRRMQAFAGNTKGLQPIVKTIRYGKKDRRWKIGESYIHSLERDAVEVWLGASFVKPMSFRHEHEIRLLMLKPSHPGGLDFKATPLLIRNDRVIANAVVKFGHF